MSQLAKITVKLPPALARRIRRKRKLPPSVYLANLVLADLERARRCGQL